MIGAVKTAVLFHIGQLVAHRRFGYRGVVFDVDPHFMLSDEWYRRVAASRPPRDRPWYHVLVDGAQHTTYVAERHLVIPARPQPIEHPLLDYYFSGFDGVCYTPRGLMA